MKTEKLIFLASIISILFLFVLLQLAPFQKGEISSITYSSSKTTISLKDRPEKLIIFENKILNLKEGDKIYFIGKEETYRNEKQIIVDKIEKIN